MFKEFAGGGIASSALPVIWLPGRQMICPSVIGVGGDLMEARTTSLCRRILRPCPVKTEVIHVEEVRSCALRAAHSCWHERAVPVLGSGVPLAVFHRGQLQLQD